jgi:hypothetical protein
VRCQDGECQVAYSRPSPPAARLADAAGPASPSSAEATSHQGEEASAPSRPATGDLPRERRRAGGQAPPAAPRLIPGERHISLVRIAGRMVNAGLSIAELRLSLHAINRSRCDPPLDDREIGDIIKLFNPGLGVSDELRGEPSGRSRREHLSGWNKSKGQAAVALFRGERYRQIRSNRDDGVWLVHRSHHGALNRYVAQPRQSRPHRR